MELSRVLPMKMAMSRLMIAGPPSFCAMCSVVSIWKGGALGAKTQQSRAENLYQLKKRTVIDID